MKEQDYTVSITTNAAAQKAFESINNVPGWWTTDFKGSSQKAGDEFTVTFGETWITIKIAESVPYQKITWQVTDCHKHWLKDKKEWKGTTINWEILPTGEGKQIINFTHIGLVPGIECYNGCEKAWDQYIKDSLFKLLNT